MYQNLEELEKECKSCTNCKLAPTRRNVVFGVGNKQAKVMLIGEGPGADEDMRRRAIYSGKQENL